MNYIAILNNFWQLREQGILDRNAGDLYLYLVHKSNSLGWKNPFNHKNELICGFLGISEKTLIANRNRLKQDGLISFVSGKKGVNTEYFITPVMGGSNYSENYRENDSLNDRENDRKTGGNTPDNIKHKLNNTKQFNKKKKRLRLRQISSAKKLGANGFSPGAEFLNMILPDLYSGMQVERIRLTQRKTITKEQVAGMWEIFKQTNFTGNKYYQNEQAIYSHFGNWLKDQKFAGDGKRETDKQNKQPTGVAVPSGPRKYGKL
jgi:hypothetical protein